METYIGSIQHFAFNYTPYQFLPCNGALLPIDRNQALYSLLGTQYGGNGTTHFAVPDLRGKSPLDKSATDCHYHICVSGIYPARPA